MIQNIVFDMGQVLIRWSPHLLMTPFNLSEEDERLVNRELFQSVEWVQVDRGVISYDDAIASVCRRLPPRLQVCVREIVLHWQNLTLIPMPDIESLVRELKAMGMHIYLLSNANISLREYFPRIPGSEFFDGLMVSAEERLIKPQHEIFEALLMRFQLRPEECYFIDDSPANVEGALRVGLSASVFYGDVPRLRNELRAAGVMVSES